MARMFTALVAGFAILATTASFAEAANKNALNANAMQVPAAQTYQSGTNACGPKAVHFYDYVSCVSYNNTIGNTWASGTCRKWCNR